MNVLTPLAPLASRRVHQRGALILALGIGCGLATFAGIAGWSGSTASPLWEGGALVGPAAFRSVPAGAAASLHESLVLRSDNRGQVLFGRYCDSCHPAGNESEGASLRTAQFKRTYAAPDKIVALVRKGGFDMPAYPNSFLSDADLADIAAYVLTLPESKEASR